MFARSLILPAVILATAVYGQGSASTRAADELLHSAHVWEAHDRGDLARLALEKLATSRAHSPETLLELGELHLRMANVEAARKVLNQLRARWRNAPATRAFEIEFRLATSDRLRLASIRRRVELGQGTAARKELDLLLPGGAPGGIFDLEYYRLLSAMPGGAQLAAEKLRALAGGHPHDSRYQLALARELIKHDHSRAEGVRRLVDLMSRDDVRVAEVEDLLARAVDAASPGQVPAEVARAYAKRKPVDQQARAAAARQARAAEEQRLLQSRALAKIQPARQRENLNTLSAALATALEPGTEAASIAEWLRGELAPRALESSNATLIAGQWALRARASMAAGRWELAEAQTAAAIALNTARYEQTIEVAERLDLLQQPEQSEQLLASARRLQPGSTWLFETYVRWLIHHRRPDEALALLDLRPTDMKWTAADRNGLRATALDQRAQQEIAAGQAALAVTDLELAVRLAPANPWSRYQLARLYQLREQPDRAREVLNEGMRFAPANDEMRYARALYLASVDELDAAYQDISAVPADRRSIQMEAFFQRLWMARATADVHRMRASGNAQGARARLAGLLKDHPEDRSLRILQADFELSMGQAARARDLYAALASENPEDWDTRLSYVRALIEAGDAKLARLQLQAIDDALPPQHNSQRITLAYRQRQLRDYSGAARTVGVLLSEPPVSPDAWLLAGYVELDRRRFAQAWDYFQRAAEQEEDMAVSASARSALEGLEARRRSWLEAAFETLRKPGDSGISEYNSATLPTLWTYAYDYERRFTLRADAITVDAGTLPTNFDDNALFGTIQANGPTASRPYTNGRESGLSLGVGYNTDRLSVDLGTTPLGFLIPRMVGGAAWHTRWGPVDVDVGVSRRAVDSSMLSYAGLRDPVTGRTWGAVVETGPSVALGLYRERYSLSGSLRRTSLSGKNVLDNDYSGLRVAAHRKLWSNTVASASIGGVLSYWSYDHNLQHYTFGSGGYYSPQSYLNVAVPVELQGSLGGWSYQLRAGVSRSSSDRDAIDFYPTDPALQAAARIAPLPPGYDTPVFAKEHGSGISVSAYAVVERRWWGPWVWGAKLDLDRADYYEPTVIALYVRRGLRGTHSTLEVPPRPLRMYGK